jgi:hypothetical protein
MIKRTVPECMNDQPNGLFFNACAVIDSTVVAARNAEEIASSLTRNRSIQSLQLHKTLFTCEGYRSPTLRRLKCLLECIPHMTQLQEVTLSGEMSIENPHDVQILANVIQRHPTLRRIKLHNFVVYAAELPNSAPLLDNFLRSCLTLPNLEALHLQCHASYKTWRQCYISVDVMGSICRSPRLQKLTLSKLGLQDEHFDCIGQMLERNKRSILSQLILSDNGNSDTGTQSIVTHLLQPRFQGLERLEILNRFRASELTSDLLLTLLDTNHSLQHCKFNLKQQYRAKVEFYLLLNRAGRRVIFNPDTLPEEAINVLGAASSNLSVLMQLLRDNPAICRLNHDCGDNNSIVPDNASPLAQKNSSSKESSIFITHKECHQLLEDTVGTISVAPAALGVVHNLATDLWRMLWARER